MPYALTIIGLLMIITGINNTYSQFGAQLQSDFTGSKSFIVWVLALFAVGALGYIKDLRSFSHYFMALILISMVLAQKGFFANLQAALKMGPATPTANADNAQTAISPNASTATIDNAIKGNQSGAFGQSPETAGQGKFNGWMNYLFGNSTNSAGATQ